MLHTCTKYQGHWSSGSGEEDERVLTIYKRGGHVTKIICIKFG